MEAPDFWTDAAASTAKMKELKSMKDDVAVIDKLEDLYSEIEDYIELGNEEEDQEIVDTVALLIEEFENDLETLRMKTLLSGEYDADSAIVTLHSGAGGVEACDWAGMLYRMYSRWAADAGFSVEELDYQEGDEAGIQSVTFEVIGENAYGYLKGDRIYENLY